MGIYSQIKKKNLDFLEIIEKLPPKPHRASETNLFFLWPRVARGKARSKGHVKVSRQPWGPMRKGRNECAITFGFGALEEGVLPSSVTLPWGGFDSFLGIFSKIMQKKINFSSNFMKISAKTTSGLRNDARFIWQPRVACGKALAEDWVKVPRQSSGANNKG